MLEDEKFKTPRGWVYAIGTVIFIGVLVCRFVILIVR
jgi:hypothetical protein